MSSFRLYLVLVPLIGASLLGHATAGSAGDGRTVLVTDTAANAPILTDRNGIAHAPHVIDPNLVTPWGLAENGSSPFWVSDNNQGVVTLYSVTGANGTNTLVASISSPGNPLN